MSTPASPLQPGTATVSTNPVAITTSTVPVVPKSGFVSSEFVTTVLAMVALAIPGIPDKYMPFIVAIAGVYAAARTALKAVHALGYAQSIPDLPAVPPLPAGSTTITTVPKS